MSQSTRPSSRSPTRPRRRARSPAITARASSGAYSAAVSVTLSAADNAGGTGVASIRYTTNGSDPSPTNGTVYTGAFSVASTTTVKYRAFDNAGNAEAVRTQLILVDTTPPTVSLTAPASGATVSGAISLIATATDNVAVDHVDFFVDGSVSGTSTSSPYGVGWDSRSVADGNHTFAARAVDTAGNSTTSTTVTATVANQSVINLLQNPSLETASGNTPTCWQLGGSGTNTFSWTHTTDAHTGGFGQSVAISAYTSGDRKLVSAQDSGACAPAVTAGRTYTVSAWYKSTRQPWFYLYYRNAAGTWTYWMQSARAIASSWTQASFTTPAIPTGATRLSVGMGIEGVGTLTLDDLALVDNAPPPDTTAPTSTITCNNGACSAGLYNAAVSVTLSATDNAGGSGVASIRYTTDGTDPSLTNGTVYTGTFSVASTTTVKYRALDNAGNAEAVRTQLIQVDTTPPTVSLTAPASGATVSGSSVTISATASDDVAVASVGFFVGATLVGTDTTSPYSISWDSTTVADGTGLDHRPGDRHEHQRHDLRGPQRDGDECGARHDAADREPHGAGQRRHGQRLERHDQRHRQR